MLKSEDARNEAGIAVDQLDDLMQICSHVISFASLTTELRDKQLGALLYENFQRLKRPVAQCGSILYSLRKANHASELRVRSCLAIKIVFQATATDFWIIESWL